MNSKQLVIKYLSKAILLLGSSPLILAQYNLLCQIYEDKPSQIKEEIKEALCIVYKTSQTNELEEHVMDMTPLTLFNGVMCEGLNAPAEVCQALSHALRLLEDLTYTETPVMYTSHFQK